MKKFIYLMAMVCTLGFFTACSSDDDNNEKEFVRNEKIEGTWKVQEAGMDPTTYQPTGSVVLKWEGSDDAVIEGVFDEPYPVKDAISMAPMLLNGKLRSVLQDVTFNEKGQISATYKEEADDKDWKVANDYASYQVVNENKITLFLNTAKITEEIGRASCRERVSMFV